MKSTKVSVIIPTYNGADFLGEAIQSVLDQTYQDFEIIVVDDVSIDTTPEIVNQFPDPRLRIIKHEKNCGANVARNTGILASTGEIIFFLDQDDLFHPEKLQTHVNFLNTYQDIGFSYNGRFNLNHSSNTIRDIWQPPKQITLADLVLGFPLSPSDMVVRRNWLTYENLWDDTRSFNGGEITFTGRLYMSGCKFGNVGRILNFRRYQAGRVFRDLRTKCNAELSAQEKIFSDPRCTKDVLALRDAAYSNTYLIWAYTALIQGETSLGQEYIRKVARLKPSVLEGFPSEFVYSLLYNSIQDENLDHELLLQKIFTQIPTELSLSEEQFKWAIGYGYLLKGARAVIWGRLEESHAYFKCALDLGVHINDLFIQKLSYDLLNYEAEFGGSASQNLISNLIAQLEKIGSPLDVRRLIGKYAVNKAFQNYQCGEYKYVLHDVWHAITNDPRYVTNKGVLAIMIHSILEGTLNR